MILVQPVIEYFNQVQIDFIIIVCIKLLTNMKIKIVIDDIATVT